MDQTGLTPAQRRQLRRLERRYDELDTALRMLEVYRLDDTDAHAKLFAALTRTGERANALYCDAVA